MVVIRMEMYWRLRVTFSGNTEVEVTTEPGISIDAGTKTSPWHQPESQQKLVKREQLSLDQLACSSLISNL